MFCTEGHARDDDPYGRGAHDAARDRPIRGPGWSAGRIAVIGGIPLTPVGDEFTPVGCLCPACGESYVTVPERISDGRPDWYACAPCALGRKRAVKADAAEVFARAGLRLLAPLTGEHVLQPVECLGCGAARQVRYRDARDGTAPLCWTCTHGIRWDEPHRVYLFRFPRLGVLKVGITHDRHDRRLVQHRVEGGELVQTVVVPDRRAALVLEARVLADRAAWRRPGVGPAEFPQGGWTEAWSDQAPPVDLAAYAPEVR
jgi:hypothetical protein